MICRFSPKYCFVCLKETKLSLETKTQLENYDSKVAITFSWIIILSNLRSGIFILRPNWNIKQIAHFHSIFLSGIFN